VFVDLLLFVEFNITKPTASISERVGWGFELDLNLL
jgi:hypothetical protein